MISSYYYYLYVNRGRYVHASACRGKAARSEAACPRVAAKPPCDPPCERAQLVIINVTRGQSNLTKSASRGAHSPVRGHPRGSKFVPLNSWGRGSY